MGVALSARALSDCTVSRSTAERMGRVAMVDTVFRVTYPMVRVRPGESEGEEEWGE